jgi:hypothetical protein
MFADRKTKSDLLKIEKAVLAIYEEIVTISGHKEIHGDEILNLGIDMQGCTRALKNLDDYLLKKENEINR